VTESSSGEGLTVTYDEDTFTFTFDWNEETHPEYNFLSGWTSQDLTKLVTEYLKQVEAEDHDREQADVQPWGPGGGETESLGDSQPPG
jgi:hypothetical protein